MQKSSSFRPHSETPNREGTPNTSRNFSMA
uniref:Uncharacterized protein n=1 Tax=Rhizophora mucronata TaxID=61149 RepID=A0A2P2NNQ6_RHIMU